MVSIFLDDFKGFVLPWAKLMLAFLEDRLKLRPESILEMSKLDVFISFILAGTRNSHGFLFIDDTAFGIS
jgi:hypothetical protein